MPEASTVQRKRVIQKPVVRGSLKEKDVQTALRLLKSFRDKRNQLVHAKTQAAS
jgi:hypothetical protein